MKREGACGAGRDRQREGRRERRREGTGREEIGHAVLMAVFFSQPRRSPPPPPRPPTNAQSADRRAAPLPLLTTLPCSPRRVASASARSLNFKNRQGGADRARAVLESRRRPCSAAASRTAASCVSARPVTNMTQPPAEWAGGGAARASPPPRREEMTTRRRGWPGLREPERERERKREREREREGDVRRSCRPRGPAVARREARRSSRDWPPCAPAPPASAPCGENTMGARRGGRASAGAGSSRAGLGEGIRERPVRRRTASTSGACPAADAVKRGVDAATKKNAHHQKIARLAPRSLDTVRHGHHSLSLSPPNVQISFSSAYASTRSRTKPTARPCW